MIKFIYNGKMIFIVAKKKKTVPGSPHMFAAIYCRSRLGLSHQSSEMHYRIQNFALFDSKCRHNLRNVSKLKLLAVCFKRGHLRFGNVLNRLK